MWSGGIGITEGLVDDDDGELVVDEASQPCGVAKDGGLEEGNVLGHVEGGVGLEDREWASLEEAFGGLLAEGEGAEGEESVGCRPCDC